MEDITDDASVICRTCLKGAKAENFVYIDDADANVENSGNVREMLQFCVPELDLYVSAKPAICNACIKTLVTVYNFKLKCLNGENMIKGYINRNNLFDYSYVNLNCVVKEENKLKNQMDGNSVQSQIENKIKKYMEEGPSEDINKMEFTDENSTEESAKEEENLQEMKDITEDNDETQDANMQNVEDMEDSIPLSVVLEKFCKPDEKATNIDKPDKVSEIITISNSQPIINKPENEETTKKPDIANPLVQQKYKIIPININKDITQPLTQKSASSESSEKVSQSNINPIIINQTSVPQAVILPQGLMNSGGKPMLIRIDMSKFMAHNSKQNVAGWVAEKPVFVKKEVVLEENEKNSTGKIPPTNSELDDIDCQSNSDEDDTDESDDSFDESPTVKVKVEPSVTITADDITDNTVKSDDNVDTTTLPKPKITLVKAESLLKKSRSNKEMPQLILRQPTDLYSILPTISSAITSTSTTQPKFIIQQATAGSGNQPKFIIQPTTSCTTSNSSVILNNNVSSQPKIIIQQNKDGTFKAVQQMSTLTPVNANNAGQKIILNPGPQGTTGYTTSLQNVIKIVPAKDVLKNGGSNKDAHTVSMENLFKIITTQQVKEKPVQTQPKQQSGKPASNSGDDYICPHCPFSTTKVDLLGKHISTVHPQPNFKVPKGVSVVENYACFLCPFSASTMELLRGHHMNFHADQLGDEQMRNFLSKKKKDKTPASLSKEQTEKELMILEKVMKRPEYACNVCIYTTKDKSNFRKHLFTHGTKPMNCPHCIYNCVSPYQMRRHYRQKHPEHQYSIPKGKPYPPLPTSCIKTEVDDDNDYKITLETLTGKPSVNNIEGQLKSLKHECYLKYRDVQKPSRHTLPPSTSKKCHKSDSKI